MLSRLETAYLGILRVVLLIAATLALLVTVIATISALPAIAQVAGISSGEEPRGGTLRDFVDSKKLSEVISPDYAADGSVEDRAQTFALPDDALEAARNFSRYDGKNGAEQLTQQEWDDIFRSILQEEVPANLHDAYSADVLRLSKQLTSSKGKALSDRQLFELLQFHHAQFLENVAAAETQKAADIASSMGKFVLAGGAFLVFVLILFNFIFVKIERNLRKVRHVEEFAE